MKKNGILLICISIFASLFLGACQSETTLHFMSYNIRNGKGMDEVFKLERVITAIQKQNPDIIALQEVDSVTTRCNGDYVLGTIADSTGMYASYAPAIDFQGGKYGVGLLSKEKPVSRSHYQLPDREEQRTLLVVEFEKYVFCCTHISLTPEDQLLSLPIIRQLTEAFQKPVFIAGDMNAHPDSEFIKGLSADFKVITTMTEPTFPADKPTETIDYIAVRQADAAKIEVLKHEVINEPLASDHRPISATLTIK